MIVATDCLAAILKLMATTIANQNNTHQIQAVQPPPESETVDEQQPRKSKERKIEEQKDEKPKNDAQNGVTTAAQIKKSCAPTVADWDYDNGGKCGPKHWLKICGCEQLGDRQSPIDLQLSKMRIFPLNSHPLCLVNYKKPLAGQLVNTGCGIQFRPNPQVEPPEIYGGLLDQNYRFIQYHFHWAQNDNEGSEHTIGGLRYPAELHLVHQGVKDPSKLAVLGIFLKLDDADNDTTESCEGEPRKFVFSPEEMDALKKITEFEQYTPVEGKWHNLAAKLPANCCRDVASCAEHFVSAFIRYQGSLTTPPCSENVVWTVFTDPLLVTREQMALLRAIKDCRGNVITKNYRPVQKCSSDREVFLMASADAAQTKL